MSQRGRGRVRGGLRQNYRGNIRGRGAANGMRGTRNVVPMPPEIVSPREVLFSRNHEKDGFIKVVNCVEIRPKWQNIDLDVPNQPATASRCPLFEKFGTKNFLILVFPKSCPPNVVRSVLETGLLVGIGGSQDKKLYRFFGHSSTQLRERKCVMYNYKEVGVFEDVISLFGEFNMTNVAKRAARIGLLLSSSLPVINLDERQITRISDIKRGGYCFTDGCGRISVSVAKMLKEKLNEQVSTRVHFIDFYAHQDQPYPSVYQVRIMGCKGTLVLDTQLKDGIVIRDSMEKVKWKLPTGDGTPLRIVEGGKGVSFPNRFGSLNTQYIRLLSALGVGDKVFLDMQKRCFEELNRIEDDQDVQVRYLCTYERYAEAEKILQTNSIDKETLMFLRKLRTTCMMQVQQVKNPRYPAKIKLRIPLEKSRTLYGVADPSEKLKDGTCFLRVTIRGTPTVLERHKVVVTKSPCYYPGDVRVLTVVNLPECSHLVDCIVFPVNGK